MVPALLGGAVASPFVFTCIAVLGFPSRFSRGFLLRSLGMPEMVALPCRVPAL